LAIGAVVGVIAASVLPQIKGMIGTSAVMLGYMP
jgi:hypothetical protein